MTANSTFPPTPESSPPNSKILYPAIMVKLAPPADDEPYQLRHTDDGLIMEKQMLDETPRRLPIIMVDTMPLDPTSSSSLLAGPSRPRLHSQKSSTGAYDDSPPVRPKSMGQPSRPIRRSLTSLPPTSVRMAESRSADSRARLKSGPGLPSTRPARPHSSHVPNTSPGFPRTQTDSAALRQSRSAISPSPGDSSDFGGPDDLEAKVVLLGSQGVGKTSLILRYTTRAFSSSFAPATIGSSLHTRKLVQSGVRVKLQIWDTAGQERFRSMAPIYYRGAHVCVLVYDISDRQSFEDVRSWLEELGKTVPKETVIFVVGAKIDLASKRAVRCVHLFSRPYHPAHRNSLAEAGRCIGLWLKPPSPPSPDQLSIPASRSLLRSSSAASRAGSKQSTSTPSRSHSHSALASLDMSTATLSSPRTPVDTLHTATDIKSATRPEPLKSAMKASTPFPVLKVDLGSAIPPRAKRISFPALQSPTKATFATYTEPISQSVSPSSPITGHGLSGGRFSISGVLGYSRANSMGGAMSTLSKLAEDYPAIRATSPTSPTDTSLVSSPRRRLESTPLSGDSSRRKTEEWSSRSWRMGEGPPASEALGQFGDGVKKKQSGDLLDPASSFNRPMGRARGGSLGRDSRLYGAETPGSSVSDEDEWGTEVEGVRIGECSALTGEGESPLTTTIHILLMKSGVEALFKAISALLVNRKDKIERDRILRHKDSIMLTDPTKDPAKKGSSDGKGRYACCA